MSHSRQSAGTWRVATRTASDAVRSGIAREARTFAFIGLVSTFAYVLLYELLRGETPAWVANALALGVTGFANTAANRRLTFGVASPRGMARDQAGGLAALGVALAITTAAIPVGHALDPQASNAVDLVTLVAANVATSVVRFTLLRRWIRSGQHVDAPVASTRLGRSAA